MKSRRRPQMGSVVSAARVGGPLAGDARLQPVWEGMDLGVLLSGYGLSALFICEGLVTNGDTTAHHVVIDPHQSGRFADCGLQFLGEAGVADLVEHHAEDSQITLPRFVQQGRTFDLAFVDGNHRFDGVFVDLVYLGRLVRSGGIVFLDDHQLPAVARAATFFVTNLGWSLEEVSADTDRHHWAVLRTADGPDARTFDHFVDF